jgi:hypothetical protein
MLRCNYLFEYTFLVRLYSSVCVRVFCVGACDCVRACDSVQVCFVLIRFDLI